MNFQQLEYIIAVHKHKHFGKAAETCNITQATLSAMIKKLEEELGIVIFDRSKKPVITTELGKYVITSAEEILLQKQRLLEITAYNSELLSGQLSIGIIPTVSNVLLPIVLPKIIKNHPELRIEIREITTDEILYQLENDQLDLGILATPIQDDRFQEYLLYYEPMMVYGAMERKKQYVSSEDIKNGKLWLLEEGHCFRKQSLTICNIQENEVVLKNLAFQSNSFETLLNLSDAFGGFTLIPELYFNILPSARRKKTRHFQKPIPVREISIITYRPYARSSSAQALSQLIKDSVEPLLSTKRYRNKDLDIIGV